MSDNFFAAVSTAGLEVFLVKGDKIIGEGVATMKRGDEIWVRMTDDRAKALVEKSSQILEFDKHEKLRDEKYHHALFKFSSYAGAYMDSAEYYCPELENVLVVEKNNLRYGMVPEYFHELPEFRSFFKEIEAAELEEGMELN